MDIYRQWSSLFKEPPSVSGPFKSYFPNLVVYGPDTDSWQEETSHVVCSSKNRVFLVKLLWAGPVVDSIETKVQKQSVVPEAISEPRTSACCSSVPAAWFVSEVIPSWNSSSLLPPGYLVVMAVWRTGFCFYFLLSFLLISSYICGIGMCHGLPWALSCTSHE